MKLNDNQKRYLFDKYYIDAEVLDSLVYKGWEDYWIDHYYFDLADEYKYRPSFRNLQLIDKDTDKIATEFYLNFQGNDYETLLKIL